MPSTSYDLIALNTVAFPDVKKGSVTVAKNPKYIEYECEDGGKVIEVIEEDMIRGNVSYNGLLQSELQTIMSALSLVSTMTIYNPAQGQARTFKALVNAGDMGKIVHDANANAWSFSFDFEEIGNA